MLKSELIKRLQELDGDFEMFIPSYPDGTVSSVLSAVIINECPIYDAEVMPDEDGTCSLCGKHDASQPTIYLNA